MYKVASLHLSKMLDFLGYSSQMRHYRKTAYQEFDKILNTHHKIKSLTVGSKGEGLTKYFESDHDILYFLETVMCVDENIVLHRNAIPQDNHITVLTMERGCTAPGYSMLKLSHAESCINPLILDSLLITGVSQYSLSSDEFSEQFKKLVKSVKHNDPNYVAPEKTGVAVRETVGLYESDTVCTLPCKVQTILREWLTRDRQNDWPPQQLRERISQIDGNIVASGFNRSFTKFLEWRICFNEIEQLLTHNLNDTQLKLYVLLKMVKKDILQPDQKEITSYTMKNIVWWLSETYPSEQFEEEHLISWVIKALRLLYRSLKMKFLPYYMLPERNLLCEEMTEYSRKRHIRTLKKLLRQPLPFFLAGLQQLFTIKNWQFESLQRLGEQRDELERLYLSYRNCQINLECYGLSENEIDMDATLLAISCRVNVIVRSSWPSHIQKQLDQVSTVIEKIEILLH